LCCQLPVLPAIYRLSLHDALPILCSTWMAARWTMFAILGATSWWHTRPRIILLAGMVMLGTMLGVLLPPFDALGINLAWMVGMQDRKSTRLNSSHVKISYAVFCLK